LFKSRHVKLPKLNAFAKAQLWGMAVGFALALLATERLGYGIRLYLVGFLISWVAWEFMFGPRAPSQRSDPRAIAVGIATGFAIPWGGFLLAFVAHALRP